MEAKPLDHFGRLFSYPDLSPRALLPCCKRPTHRSLLSFSEPLAGAHFPGIRFDLSDAVGAAIGMLPIRPIEANEILVVGLAMSGEAGAVAKAHCFAGA